MCVKSLEENVRKYSCHLWRRKDFLVIKARGKMQTKDSIFGSQKSLKRTENLTDYDKRNLGKLCRECPALHTDIFSKE